LVDINELKGRGAIELLRMYDGINPYIKDLKNKLIKDGKVKLTDGQADYINKFHDVPPQVLNKVVSINPLLGTSLQEKEDLSFTPERILIQAMLADQEKTYHIYGKIKKNQKYSKMYFLPKTLVLDDPYFTECEVDIEWDDYVSQDKLGRTPYEHQKSGIEFLTCRGGAILADDMGLGKMECVNNQVFTPNGREKIGNLKAGDYVIGSNGKKTKVTKIHPQGEKELFRVTFNDGYSVLVGGEHLWSVTSNNGSVNNKNRLIRYTTLSTNQMLDEDLVIEQLGTGWNKKRPYKFKTYYKQSNGQNKWQIPIVKPIEFENEYLLPIEPYLLGVSLGDGNIRENKVYFTIHKDDFNELFDGIYINETSKHDNVILGDVDINYGVLSELNLNNTLSHTKFIPDVYKYSSIEDRLAILQGLMDTDGHCMKSNNGNFVGAEYCSVSEQLADDVAEIVHSLGGIVRKSSKIGSYKKEDGTKVLCKRAYRLNIKLPEGMNPFRLKRKSDMYNTPKKYKVGRYIKDIRLETVSEAVCITVDAQDSLYVTEHGIVTHNTYQSIFAALVVGAKKVLVVCPASVKISWQREIESFGQKGIIVSGSNWPHVGRFTIINYDILKNFHTLGKFDNPEEYSNFLQENYDLIILDEAHIIKNPKAQRTKLMNDIVEKSGVEKVWLLTGTPIANRPMDFFNLLKLVSSPLGGNWKFYAQRYCDAKRFYKRLKNGRTKQIWVTDGASNLSELGIRTKNTLLRRLKRDALDMPDKTITTLYHDLNRTGWSKYESIWDDYLEKRVEDGKRKTSSLHKDIVELGLLRKFIAMQAIPKTVELAKDAMEQGQKVVIFTTFTEELNDLSEEFGNACVIHNGTMTANAKQNSIDKFQNNNKTKVFIGNITSAGVGITLTEGTVVIFNSFSWVPGDNEQAEDRCIFGGQNVLTNNGYKLIEDIEIGDKVYTHNGNFKNVNNKTSHLERKKLRYDINAFGFNQNLSITHDHKLYVYDKSDTEFKWLEAKDLNILNHSLTIKSEAPPLSNKKYLIPQDYINKNFENNHGFNQINGRLFELPKRILLTNDLLYAFGFFIADGWTSTKEGKSSTVNVCQKVNNPKMCDASEYIIKIIKENFRIEKHSSYIDKNNVKTCTIHSKNLALNFKQWFGSNVYNKQLPEWVDELNKSQLTSLLDGYYHGDGYQRKNTQQATTASLKLISQLIRYNANLGRTVSLSNKGLNNYSMEYTFDNFKNKKIKHIGNYITYPIKNIHISKPKRGEERVYDLSVEDDHSFVVGNYNVHNCYRIGQENNVSVYYQLFRGTISLAMWYSLMKKQKNIDEILNKNDEHSERLSRLMGDLEENGLEL